MEAVAARTFARPTTAAAKGSPRAMPRPSILRPATSASAVCDEFEGSDWC